MILINTAELIFAIAAFGALIWAIWIIYETGSE